MPVVQLSYSMSVLPGPDDRSTKQEFDSTPCLSSLGKEGHSTERPGNELGFSTNLNAFALILRYILLVPLTGEIEIPLLSRSATSSIVELAKASRAQYFPSIRSSIAEQECSATFVPGHSLQSGPCLLPAYCVQP